jgi:hypothetical protein
MAECDTSIALIMVQLEKALGDERAASLTLVQARVATTKTVRAFWGLAIQVRPALGLEPLAILSAPQGDIALWFTDVVRRISSLSERLRLVL